MSTPVSGSTSTTAESSELQLTGGGARVLIAGEHGTESERNDGPDLSSREGDLVQRKDQGVDLEGDRAPCHEGPSQVAGPDRVAVAELERRGTDAPRGIGSQREAVFNALLDLVDGRGTPLGGCADHDLQTVLNCSRGAEAGDDVQ